MSISVRRSSKTVFLYSLAWPDSVWVRAMKKWPSLRTSIWQSTPSASFSSFGAGDGSAASPLAARVAPMADSGPGLAAGLPEGLRSGFLAADAGLAAGLAGAFAGALAAVFAGAFAAGLAAFFAVTGTPGSGAPLSPSPTGWD